MNKIQSLLRLGAMGLNTPELLVKMESDKEKDKWYEYYHKHDGRVSVRTEKGSNFKCPHFPNVRISKAHAEIPLLLNQGYSVYVFRPIDPSGCLYRGNFWGKAKNPDDPISKDHYGLEYLRGPGTVRDLEKVGTEEIISHSFRALESVAKSQPQQIFDVVEKLMPLSKFLDQIVEWSYYQNPIGSLKQNAIFWEIRDCQ